MNEADTCRTLVRPKLEAAGWDGNKHFFSEQTAFTDGRIIVPGGKPRRLKKKFSDFLLRYTRDITLAVVEAKSDKHPAGNAVQQTKEYAEILGLKFAYATNGATIIEYDYFTGLEAEVERFPTPDELWFRYQQGQGLSTATANALLAPFFHQPGREPRYYQRIAIQRSVETILGGKRRCLLTMATGTGKTMVAFQICWKLWSAGWNSKGDHRKPRILFLADRNVLVDDPKDKTFAPFGDARHKIENGVAIKSREMYFAIYQAIAKDERRPGLYKEYARDFFDLIVVDECHRGSSRDESNWREILEYFEPAYQLGMTATPLREDNRDTYIYFGNPLYTYSLKQGIADGFLAPYRVHRILTTYDAAGWRPNTGQLDLHGREIPDAEYHTKDFERTGGVSLEARTEAIGNFPEDKQTSETALLFLQLIMRKLRVTPKPGRAGVVVPNGTLFGDGVCARIKQDLLTKFNLHTIVRLPNGVFAPYTSIPTNLLFFDRSGPTEHVWYYEQPLPEGRKNYTKTAPIQFEEFAGCQKWWSKRKENDRAWKVPVQKILDNNFNLDIKNPSAKDDFEHLPPEQLADDILQKELRIAEIMQEIKELLRRKP